MTKPTTTAGPPPPGDSNTYDAMGNVIDDGTIGFTYSDRGRLSAITFGTETVNYKYNARGERVVKIGPTSLVPSGERHFAYDANGNQIGEYEADKAVVHETVYLDGLPVIVLKTENTGTTQTPAYATSIYNVYADQISTPRVITTSDGSAVVWRWDGAEPFGASPANDDPNQSGVFEYNHRFPGQTYDKETGLHYNYFRDYNPRTGRYVQSDPIGLAGGINTYAYVGSSPSAFTDPLGLARFGHRSLGADTKPPPGMTRWGDWGNVAYLHEQLWFDDDPADNVGFFGGDGSGWGPAVCGERGSVRQDHGHARSEYRMLGPVLDDTIARMAVDAMSSDWDGARYCLFGSNCQGFAEAVRQEYQRIESAIGGTGF